MLGKVITLAAFSARAGQGVVDGIRLRRAVAGEQPCWRSQLLSLGSSEQSPGLSDELLRVVVEGGFGGAVLDEDRRGG